MASRADAFRQGMPMGPVRRGDPVVAAQDVAHAYSHGLLALVLVKGPGDLPFQEEAEDALFETSNEQHPSVQRRRRRSPRLDHLLTHGANDRGPAGVVSSGRQDLAPGADTGNEHVHYPSTQRPEH